MRRHGYLFEQVVSFESLVAAAYRAARGKKTKRVVAAFLFNLENEIIELERELVSGSYRPLTYRTFSVQDPKERTICAAPFRDRVVHHAVCRVLDPILEKSLICDTYACRREKGTHRAIRRAQAFSRRYRYFLKLDIAKFYDSVDHDILKGLLRRRLKDGRLLDLLDTLIEHPVPWTPPGQGLPIGNLTSQYFANYYLSGLDHLVKEQLGIPAYLRYMDDMVLFADGKEILWQAGARMQEYADERLELQFNEGAQCCAPVGEGLAFLGFRVFPGVIRLQHRGWRRFRRRLFAAERLLRGGAEETDRADHALRSVASLVGHVQHADTRNLRVLLFARPGAMEA